VAVCIKGNAVFMEKQMAQGKRKFIEEHGSLSEEKRLIHHFVVGEFPFRPAKRSAPISPKKNQTKFLIFDFFWEKLTKL
jgi:hypothetical protein